MLKMIKNDKGFSFIELIVVIAVIVVALSLSAGSLTTMYHARSLQVAKTIDGMVSQSKVNALSGRKNIMVISYNPDEDVYDVGLHAAIKNENGKYVKLSGNYIFEYDSYEHQTVGNNTLDILFNYTSGSGSASALLKDEDNNPKGYLILDFNADTGAVKNLAFCDSESSIDDGIIDVNGKQIIYICPNLNTASPKKASWNGGSNSITIKSYSTHQITLYQKTGEHTFS